MIRKSLLAATVASGLIVPMATAGVYLPSKPSIIKSENVEFSKHMLLGMPITMGMLTRKTSSLIAAYTGVTSSGTTGGTLTATVGIGTAAAGRYVVVIGWSNDSSAPSVNSCTVGGATTTRVASFGGADAIAMFITDAPVTSGTTASVAVTYSGAGVSNRAFSVYSLTGPVNTTPLGVIQSGVTTSTTLSVIAGGAIISGVNLRNNTSTVTYTGLTSDNQTIVSGAHVLASAKYNATAAETRSLSYSPSGSWVAASFSPA